MKSSKTKTQSSWHKEGSMDVYDDLIEIYKDSIEKYHGSVDAFYSLDVADDEELAERLEQYIDHLIYMIKITFMARHEDKLSGVSHDINFKVYDEMIELGLTPPPKGAVKQHLEQIV